MSINTIYPELEEQVYSRFAKVPVHMISGTRVDPHDHKSKIPWVLKTETRDYDLVTKKRNFSYESEVIELYSKYEHDTFLRLNSTLIKEGLLKEYAGMLNAVDSANAVNDEELLRIVNIRSNADFNAEIEQFDSPLTLSRLKDVAVEAGKSVKRVQAIEAKIEALNGNS